MIKKLFLIALLAGYTLSGSAQVKFGPVIDLGFGFYSKTSDSLTLKGGLNPSFGGMAQLDINYLLSLRGAATYSFKTLQTTRVNGKTTDKMNGQFLDLSVSGRFSNFDEDVKLLPYGTAGLGAAFAIVSKLQEKYMKGCSYNSAIPYFTVGAGTGIKMSYFSEFDLSLNYTRYLSPMFTIPVGDKKDARLNQISLKVAALF